MARRATAWLTFSIALLFLFSACSNANTSSPSSVINVVAAENFYGDIVKQLGGSHVSVTSILSDPSVDPHQYESGVQTGIAVSKAQLVIENAGGYDSWMDRLLAASPNSNRIVLKGYNTAPTLLSENEHVWYSVDNVAAIAQAITNDLKKLDPADATTFDHNLNAFQQSLLPIRQKMSEIKAKYNGTPVGLTETIYLYQTGPLGLNVLTPFVFQKAMTEGNDPPVASVITAEKQINQQQIKVLIYNEQTITPSTTKLERDAQQQHIPIVPVTETMPSTRTYQTWMLDQLNALEQALGQ